MDRPDSLKMLSRRTLLQSGLAATALFAQPFAAQAEKSQGFDAWREHFHARALAKGISEASWDRAMAHVQPDTSVFKEFASQPEFTEETWQYINRRVSDWRIINGKAALKKNEALFARIEKDFGVERGTLLALWGVESAFGDPLVQQNHMRPIFPIARRARLERAAPQALLGKRADQRASHRRSRLEHSAGDARLLGRRDGPHPVDARSLAACRHRL